MKRPENSFQKTLYAGKKQGLLWLGLSSPYSAKVVSGITGKVD
jgi:2-keto-3-deoxy-L-rhamnonate aldolase RhmA